MINPLTQDACAFYANHSVLEEFAGVVYEEDEGVKVANTLADDKAVFMKNHVPLTVDAIALWFSRLERSCQVHLSRRHCKSYSSRACRKHSKTSR